MKIGREGTRREVEEKVEKDEKESIWRKRKRHSTVFSRGVFNLLSKQFTRCHSAPSLTETFTENEDNEVHFDLSTHEYTDLATEDALQTFLTSDVWEAAQNDADWCI
ncbi:hypothetical protein F2P81_010396 [Scophthalmus maximus]|uniref:Uncharacterized protein n=1 Tax=Scophthalmus maximus TaxID=52904 RepID=A0A6A4T5P3_SCOMX|nr:hypothetical protein F2P81_010396 [Scophthalmus maximus]